MPTFFQGCNAILEYKALYTDAFISMHWIPRPGIIGKLKILYIYVYIYFLIDVVRLPLN